MVGSPWSVFGLSAICPRRKGLPCICVLNDVFDTEVVEDLGVALSRVLLCDGIHSR